MWGRIMMILIALLLTVKVSAQSDEVIGSIMKLTGCASAEELDGYEVERLSSYLDRPFKVNLASAAQLKSCGLFSAYQVASIIDYRIRHGYVLSLVELSAVDGFGEDAVSILSPFISLVVDDLNLHFEERKTIRNDLSVKGGVSVSEGVLSGQYGLKYRCMAGERFSLALSASRSRSVSSMSPDSYSGHLRYEFRRLPLKLIAGDFNARFGQGLALWNGMSLSGLSKLSSFYRRSSGLSESWSFTGNSSLTGLAGELSMSRLRVSAFFAMPMLSGINVGWYGKNISMSMTHYVEFSQYHAGRSWYIPDMKTSADFASCINGVDIFAETAFDWVNASLAGLASTVFPVGEDLRMALNMRYYPSAFDPSLSASPRSGTSSSNEAGISAACTWTAGRWVEREKHDVYSPSVRRFVSDFSLDAAWFPEPKQDDAMSFQIKALADCQIMASPSLKLNLRTSGRYRTWGGNFIKTEVRADLSWKPSAWSLNARIHVAVCKGTAMLSYLEGGYKTSRTSLYLRQGFFHVDNWDDRIYAYERDAPGSFSVPVFYGRGVWTSAVASFRVSRFLKLYLRGSLTAYPFMNSEKKKPGKAELKLQCVLSI